MEAWYVHWLTFSFNPSSALMVREVKHKSGKRCWSLKAKSSSKRLLKERDPLCQSLEMHWSLLQVTLLSAHLRLIYRARDSMSLDSMATKAPKEPHQLLPVFSSEIQNNESCHGITTLKIFLQSLHYFWYSDSSLYLSSKDKGTYSVCIKEPRGIKHSYKTPLIDWCLLARDEGIYIRGNITLMHWKDCQLI